MPGTVTGGKKAAAANLAKDPDFYKKIGSKGGKQHRPETRPFYANRDLAKRAGHIGGKNRHGTKEES